jgi:uncharacterized membrane protein
VDESFFTRLDSVETRLRKLQREVAELRADATFARPAAPAPAPSAPAPEPRQAPQAPPPPAALPPRPPRPRIDVGARLAQIDLFGAKALASAGGVVTILGIVFFFVLAVNRGWIGAGTRVGLGAAASAIVFAAGVWLRRRYGETHASLAAVGAGIAGGYATLAAATILYDLIPEAAALGIASAIAAAALAVALRWRAELIAALGLVGAIVAPALLALQDGISAGGTAFAAIVLAAALAFGIRERWTRLVVVATLAAGAQSVALVVDAAAPRAPAVAVTAAFWLLFLAVAPAYQLLNARDRVGSLVSSYALGSAGFVFFAAAVLYGGGRDRGVALLVAATVYAVAAGALHARPRELSVLLGAIGLMLAAVATADLVSGPVLTYTFAGEALLLAFLGTRLREVRFQLASLAYLSAAAVHALVFEADPDHLFVAQRHPASGAPALLAVALAAAGYARLARAWSERKPERGVLRPVARAAEWLRVRHSDINAAALATAAVATAYAASLGILELFERFSSAGMRGAFQQGHVAVTAMWFAVGLVVLRIGVARSRNLFLGAVAWLGVTVAKVALYDAGFVATHRSYSFIAAGVGAFAALLIVGLRAPRDDASFAVILMSSLSSLAFLLAAGTTLATGTWAGVVDADGAAVLMVALPYAAAAAAVFRAHRDLSTLLWTVALAVAAVAEAMLVGDTWLVLTWAASAAGLAVLARVATEERFRFGSFAYLALAATVALVAEAPPSDLVVARVHPATGVPAVVLVAAAAAVFAALATDAELDVLARLGALWSAGVLAVYGASLGIIDLVERVSTADLHTEFQRGHTAVSAFWGTLGLVLLYVGLVRRRRGLRLGGFALFGVSLSKIFLYDLPTLSSVTRALSFLAVGAVLLLGGFFYQRLAADRSDGVRA